MKMKLVLAASAMTALVGLSHAACAAEITRTYDVTASDFVDSDGELGSVQTFNAVYSLTFDDAVDTSSPSTSGLTVVSNTLPYSTAYTYFFDGGFPDTLTLATYPGSGSPEYGNDPDSYGTFIGGATATTPFSYGVGYYENGNEYYSQDSAVTASPLTSSAPEPSSWVLMIAGIGGIGLTMRRAGKLVGLKDRAATV